jgi:hypothetical protein
MTTVRRVLLLTLVAVAGISLIAPLSARSGTELPDTPRDLLLAHQPTPRADTARGGVLSARRTSLEMGATTRAEAVDERRSDAPADVRMEATLVGISTAVPVRPTAAYGGDSVWDALAMCESGGNWAINTGNGYYGGLQFSLGAWNGYGGAEFAEYPHQATRGEQIIVAERLRAARGYAPWPACRTKLGLP